MSETVLRGIQVWVARVAAVVLAIAYVAVVVEDLRRGGLIFHTIGIAWLLALPILGLPTVAFGYIGWRWLPKPSVGAGITLIALCSMAVAPLAPPAGIFIAGVAPLAILTVGIFYDRA